MAQRMKAHEVAKALRESFGPPSFAFLEQVANGTGFSANRWADAIAVGVWPSRGLLIHGFEIKVSKSDWRNELKDPAKSAEVQKYCDRWWIAAPKGIVEKHELPPTWGLLEVSEKGKLLHTVTAPALEAETLTRSFLAAMIRRQAEAMDQIVARERRDAEQKAASPDNSVTAQQLETTKARLEQLEKRVSDFEAASGISLMYEWDAGQVGRIVNLIRNQVHFELPGKLRVNAREYARIAQELERHAQEAELLIGPKPEVPA